MEAEPLAPNLHALVEGFCLEDPEALAWVFFDSNETLTRRDIFDRITRLASSLYRIGVGKGTHVAVSLPNVSAFPITWLALWIRLSPSVPCAMINIPTMNSG